MKDIIKEIKIESLIVETAKLPTVRIDRESFLRRELSRKYKPEIVNMAIEYNPAYAGIKKEDIKKIAKSCIESEANKVTLISAAMGFPGGFSVFAAIPADLIQFFSHVLRIVQKLIYLYGWPDLNLDSDGMDDETQNRLILFLGMMFGVNGAASVVRELSAPVASHIAKRLPQQALTKGMIYPIVKKVATILGTRMTKDVFAKGVAKVIPVISSAINGGMTYFTFKHMARHFRKHLASCEIANSEYYRTMRH